MDPSGSILIVDDDPAILEAVSTALVPPYRVLTAENGVEALGIVAQEALNLVLLDYMLPDASGLALLHAIQRIAPSLPIILMTGFGSEDVAVESFRSGVRDYLKKPFSIPNLVARVERILGTSKRTARPESSTVLGPVPVWPSAERRFPSRSLQRAIAYVEAQLHTPISLDRVAREAGMSKFHFCRVFKSEMGLTFGEFLARRRIARAVELLRDPDRSLTDIYLDVGFKDMSHFGRVFRKLTGQSPSRFRRMAAEIPRGKESPGRDSGDLEEGGSSTGKARPVQ